MRIGRSQTRRIILLGVFLIPSLASAYDWSDSQLLCPGVKYVHLTAGYTPNDTNPAHVLQINCVQIDAKLPGIGFYASPQTNDNYVNGSREANTISTRNFINGTHGTGSNQKNVVLAVNANLFDTGNNPTNMWGLEMSEGMVVSSLDSGDVIHPSFLVNKAGSASISMLPYGADTSSYWTAVSGKYYSLVNGVAEPNPDWTKYRAARTGLGLSADNRYAYFLTIDAESGWSDGAYINEEGLWLQYFDAYNGINLDGGGSTTMARWDATNGASVLLNDPTGSGRAVAASIGVYYVPEPSSLAILATLAATGLAVFFCGVMAKCECNKDEN